MLAAITAGALVLPAVAHAAPKTFSFEYHCKAATDGNAGEAGSLECNPDEADLLNPTGPTFNPAPEPTIYTFGIVISYDPTAGVVAFTQTEPDAGAAYDPNNDCVNNPGGDDTDGNSCDDNGLQIAALWANTGRWTLSDGTYTPGPATATTLKFGNYSDETSGYADWTSSTTQQGFANSMGLTETGVRGTLQPVVTISGDSITYSWTSSLLKGLNMTKVASNVEGVGSGLPFTFGPSYFPGDRPVPPLPNLPVDGSSAQFKPAIFDEITGDGSAVLGGSTGHVLEPRRLNDIGELHWTSWTATSATATGQVWEIYGAGCNACDHTLQDSGKATVHVYDPVNSVFTQMAVTYGPGTYREPGRKTTYSKGGTERLTWAKSDGSYFWQIHE